MQINVQLTIGVLTHTSFFAVCPEPLALFGPCQSQLGLLNRLQTPSQESFPGLVAQRSNDVPKNGKGGKAGRSHFQEGSHAAHFLARFQNIQIIININIKFMASSTEILSRVKTITSAFEK